MGTQRTLEPEVLVVLIKEWYIIENLYLDDKEKIYVDKQQADLLEQFFENQEEHIATLIALSYVKEFFKNNLLTNDEYNIIRSKYAKYFT